MAATLGNATVVLIPSDGLTFITERVHIMRPSVDEQVLLDNIGGSDLTEWWITTQWWVLTYAPENPDYVIPDSGGAQLQVDFTGPSTPSSGYNALVAFIMPAPVLRPTLQDLVYVGVYGTAGFPLEPGQTVYFLGVSKVPMHYADYEYASEEVAAANVRIQGIFTGGRTGTNRPEDPIPFDPDPGTDPPIGPPMPGTVFPLPYETPIVPRSEPVPAPAVTEPGTTTLIDIVRKFSERSMRPVRLTGPSSIEVVDLDAPLPAGYTTGDGAAMYSASTRSIKAGEAVLSVGIGDVAITASADLVADDVRVITSAWQCPDRLPVPGFDTAAPVSRFSFDFTPKHFTGSVEFAFRDVPLIVRGE